MWPGAQAPGESRLVRIAPEGRKTLAEANWTGQNLESKFTVEAQRSQRVQCCCFSRALCASAVNELGWG